MRLLYNVAAIHELPLIVPEAFSTIDVFKKLNCYLICRVHKEGGQKLRT